MPEPTTGCWLWIGKTDMLGYGSVRREHTSETKAHRLSHKISKGINPGLYVLHKCDVRCCVNPDHLYQGDQKQNVKDMIDRGREGFRFKKGNGFARRKLTKENVLEIKNTFVPGTKSWRTLAEKFNVSQSLIHSIIRGHVWI